jgi:hypothetical protein
MSEPIKITEEELSEVRMLRGKFHERVVQFGTLYLEKMQVEAQVKSITDKEQELQQEWKNLQKMEDDLLDKIIKKYGEGSLDLENGTLVPSKK